MALPPDLPDDRYEFYWSNISTDASTLQPATTIPRLAPQYHTVTYMAQPSNIAHHSSFKHWRLIDDSVYVLTSHCHYVSEPAPPDPNTLDLHPPFSSRTNLSSASLGKTPTAFAAVDNKADTLTQSQMLKDPDWALFIASQQAEKKGLQKMEVFEVLPISAKPKLAKILSSIWSYRRKKSPVGTILKHKSRLCVDGLQQLHGRDFWETYAP